MDELLSAIFNHSSDIVTNAGEFRVIKQLTEKVFFVETIDESNRAKFEKDYMDSDTGVMVHPQFVQIHTLV